MTDLRKFTCALALAWTACSSETAIVATLDGQGGLSATSGGASGASTGGAAGSSVPAAGGARQESGGAAVQTGGLASFGGASGGAFASNGGASAGGAAAAGATTGGASAGGVAGFAGNMALDAGAGGLATGGSSGGYCACAESHSICDSDGETHICFGNDCPPVMILCLHECPCGVGETATGANNLWYPAECFDSSSCATSSFCAAQPPNDADIVTDCASASQRR